MHILGQFHVDIAIICNWVTQSPLILSVPFKQWNRMEDERTGWLAHALRGNTVLKELYLASNRIGDIGAARLVEALRGNALRVLNLRYNKVGDKGAALLASALQDSLMTLEELDLEDNKISDEGAGRIADALRSNTAMVVLNLNNNFGIGMEGAKRLAHGLQGNTTLKELHLQHNMIGFEGACRLAEMLRVNTALQKLYLKGSKIRVKGAKLLADALRANTALEVLEIDWGLPMQLQGILDRNRRLKSDALQRRRLIFVWCTQIVGGLPVEIVEMIVRQSVWDHTLLSPELKSFLSRDEREVLAVG
eukprot:TRINITY_DN6830_c0_g1_i2.p2 TRINITY_DN6830_c0_g1~~TRINITY_DN6830_c0_g1_i2.p2  ORF type:complete len:306 (+),score=11.98 TRINITY_DN6830_c0_g1_i2:189-1106(+)